MSRLIYQCVAFVINRIPQCDTKTSFDCMEWVTVISGHDRKADSQAFLQVCLPLSRIDNGEGLRAHRLNLQTLHVRSYNVLVFRLLPCVSQADFIMEETPEISWNRRERPTNPLWWSRLMPMSIRK